MKKFPEKIAQRRIRLVTTKGQTDPSGAQKLSKSPSWAVPTLYLSLGKQSFIPIHSRHRMKIPRARLVVPTTQSPSLAAVVPRNLLQDAYKTRRTEEVSTGVSHPSSRKGESSRLLSHIRSNKSRADTESAPLRSEDRDAHCNAYLGLPSTGCILCQATNIPQCGRGATHDGSGLKRSSKADR